MRMARLKAELLQITERVLQSQTHRLLAFEREARDHKDKVVAVWRDLGGPPLVGRYTAVGAASNQPGTIDKKLADLETKEGINKPADSQLFGELFGVLGAVEEEVRFAPGTAHYRLPGKVHPDDLRTISAFDLFCRSITGHPKVIRTAFFMTDFKANFVCAGSPLSNFMSRVVMQYDSKSNDPEDGLVRGNEPILETRYEALHDSAYVFREFGWTARKLKSQVHRVPNWSIRDVVTRSVYVPKLQGPEMAGRFATDYLLVSVVPNILDEQSFERGRKIIILGGTHGIATRVSQLLFADKVLLRQLSERVKTPYWQALLEIDSVDYDNTGEAHPASIRLVDVAAVGINSLLLHKWFCNLPYATPVVLNRIRPRKEEVTRYTRDNRSVIDEAKQIAKEVFQGFQEINAEDSGATTLFEHEFIKRAQNTALLESREEKGLALALPCELRVIPEKEYLEAFPQLERGRTPWGDNIEWAKKPVGAEFERRFEDALMDIAHNNPGVLHKFNKHRQELGVSTEQLLRAILVRYFDERNFYPSQW